MFNLVFTRRFCMAHRFVSGLSEKCAVPHGHNELVTVRLESAAGARLDGRTNMVVPFERAKATWHKWIDDYVDHSLQLSADDPLVAYFQNSEPDKLPRLVITPGDPTTEMLATCFMAKLNAFLSCDGGCLRCVEVEIEETPTNSVTFDGKPEDFLPHLEDSDHRVPWWHRPDWSINNLECVPARQGTAVPMHATAKVAIS